MSRDETKLILMSIMASYPNWKPMSFEATVNTWYMMLSDYEYTDISAALKAYILTDAKGFAPSIGQLIDKITSASSELTPIEAWSLVYGRMQNSIYHAEENFNSLPDIIKRVVGSAEVLRQWAMTDSDSVTVIQANFVRAYNAEVAKERETRKLPVDFRKLLQSTSQRLIGAEA